MNSDRRTAAGCGITFKGAGTYGPRWMGYDFTYMAIITLLAHPPDLTLHPG